MAYMGEDSVLGHEELMSVVGEAVNQALARITPGRPAAGGRLQLPARPQWRDRLAPGVHEPGKGMEMLPMVETLNKGVISATNTQLSFEAKPQRPFRGERLSTIVIRVGPTAGAIPAIDPAVFVGTHVEATALGKTPLEVFQPGAFGVRLSMVQAEPGILVTIPVSIIGSAPTAPDQINVSCTIIGQTVR